MKTSLYIAILTLTLYIPVNSKAQCYPQDSLALVEVYNTLGGSSWLNNTNWLIGPVHTWFGIEMNPDNTRVLKVSLCANNLEGFIPNSITNLTFLFIFIFIKGFFKIIL